jgi:nicotinate-nucleotide pyrophosphorylase (carboxylating)
VLRVALEEDLRGGDVTSDVLIPPDRRARGVLLSKATGVISGLPVFSRVFELLEAGVRIRSLVEDGARIGEGDRLLEITGSARTLLRGERTALNFVQRMSGTATLARRYVEAVEERASVLDTRKTTPGLRALEKYAVRCGGACNHRFGLWDEAMIKNNHVDLAEAGLAKLTARLREEHGEEMRIHVEARDEAEALDAVRGGADVVLLDNMSPDRMEGLCRRMRILATDEGRTIEIEASGGITLRTIRSVAGCGVDRISVGALTHSAPALDLSFRIEVLP